MTHHINNHTRFLFLIATGRNTCKVCCIIMTSRFNDSAIVYFTSVGLLLLDLCNNTINGFE